MVVTLEPAKDEHDEDDIHDIYDGILEDYATNMAEEIEVGNFGAIQTDDPGESTMVKTACSVSMVNDSTKQCHVAASMTSLPCSLPWQMLMGTIL